MLLKYVICGQTIRRRLALALMVSLWSGAPTAFADDDAEQADPPAEAAESTLSAKEIARLEAIYQAMTPFERIQMEAVYRDLDVDLLALFGEDAGDDKAAGPTLLELIRKLDFARKPQAVLAARAQLGFHDALTPAAGDAKELAEWLHLQVMAGEWTALADFMTTRSGDEAIGIYAHILQSTNQGDAALLPEEVLAIADAAPDDLTDWQLDVLGQLLRSAAQKYSARPMIERIAAGTRMFGDGDDARRQRTARFLGGGGLAQEAYAYLPPLADARATGDAAVVFGHARYNEDYANRLRTDPAAPDHRRQAWRLYCEVTDMALADFELRRSALRHAIDLMPTMPPADVKAWITAVFDNEALGPAALEIIALKAITIPEEKTTEQQRAVAILTMKEAVDILLANPDIDVQIIRVPLRMLTTVLIGEAEATIKKTGSKRGVAPETAVLIKAMPGESWLAALEPSLATRAYRAAVGIATIADETDAALDLLAQAAARFPDQADETADYFLELWEQRLNPPVDKHRDPYGFRRFNVPAAPLTRGRQRRNLDRLARVSDMLADIGVDARRLPSVTAAFKACHGKTEPYTRASIDRVFGPVHGLPPQIASALAESMASGLNGDWRSRQAQRNAGAMRSAAEIAHLVEEGYELALELIDQALARRDDSWRDAMIKAALNYDRVQFKKTQQDQDFATFNEYRRAAFAAFADAARQYERLLAVGEQRAEADVYLMWFNAALGGSELRSLTTDDLLIEGSDEDDQIVEIRNALTGLPQDAIDRHMAAFARALAGAVPGMDPEIKPRVVRHAMRILQDHPAGAPLRRLDELYEDLVKDEIKLRMTIDGSDRVGTDRAFGVLLTLRFTNSVDRETGGFDKYLRNDVWVRVGNGYRPMNYRDHLRKMVESALNESFTLDSMGFFEALTPSREVMENGEEGWQEKPVAYMIVRVHDASVDHLPQIALDMQFTDQSGAVTLAIVSNVPPLDAASVADDRPVKHLEVAETVDLRRLRDGHDEPTVVVEIRARGDGIVPELDELLTGLEDVLPGYAIGDDGIEARPPSVLQPDDKTAQASQMWRFASQQPTEAKAYPKPDENGMYRLPSERTWVVSYHPSGSGIGDRFVAPRLRDDDAASLQVSQYADMDIVPVEGGIIAVTPTLWTRTRGAVALVALLVIAVLIVVFFRTRAPTISGQPVAVALPRRITPLSAIATLERIHREFGHALNDDQRHSLAREIDQLQRSYFGPDDPGENPPPGDLRGTLDRWAGQISTNGSGAAVRASS